MKFKTALILAAAMSAMTACAKEPPLGQAYWQRVEDNSALYMTGPKAQQQLDEDIAGCVRVVDELVELDALRDALPPDTHSDYHKSLKASGDLDFYDTPTRYQNKKVSHSDFHDFEGCMRHAGWERVKYVRYHTALQAKENDKQLQLYRETGLMGEAGLLAKKRKKLELSGATAPRNNN